MFSSLSESGSGSRSPSPIDPDSDPDSDGDPNVWWLGCDVRTACVALPIDSDARSGMQLENVPILETMVAFDHLTIELYGAS